MVDVLIHGGEVSDGHGGPLVRADVGIDNGQIAFVGRSDGIWATSRIDATDQIVCPGFIDMHSHADLALLNDPASRPKVEQGVTTEIIGNCGWGPAPISPDHRIDWRRAAAPALGDPDVDWSWTSFGDYIDLLRAREPGVNVASLVPHGAVRHTVRGMDAGPMSAGELEQMCQLVDDAMSEGALGLSGGLVYPPGVYAETAEFVELARVVGRRGGLLTLHIRNYGRRLVDAVDEALSIARQAQVRLQISHMSIIGSRNDGVLPLAIERIEQAHAAGLPVAFDQQPYEGACSILSLLLPGWVTEGGIDATSGRLAEPESRARLAEEWMSPVPVDPWWENYVGHIGWNNILIVGTSELVPDDAKLVGLTIAEAADARGSSPAETTMDLWLAHGGAVTIVLRELFSRATVETIFKHPMCMVETDAVHIEGLPHPRLYGTYPRVLGEYVRERQLVTWGQAVAKMTGMPATEFGLQGRGFIEPGMAADVVVFDPAEVHDNTTYLTPHRRPTGINHVLVNGVVAGTAGAGRVLAGPARRTE
jgi:N-acyl-D-aspartate/D-glutamate deacylase